MRNLVNNIVERLPIAELTFVLVAVAAAALIPSEAAAAFAVDFALAVEFDRTTTPKSSKNAFSKKGVAASSIAYCVVLK